ncbi:MAG: efflux RND transporter periplasmic adaptor subunit [Bryobacteraceae bacterium]
MGAFRRGVIQGGSQPVPVEPAAGLPVQRVQMRKLPVVSEAVGTVQAEQLVILSSRVVANIVEMRASAGQKVARGEVLVVLDDRDLRHRLQQAQEAVRSAEATLAQARADYLRDKPLFEKQVIPAYDFEHMQTNLKIAEANLQRLQEAEKEAQVNLTYAVIRSPFEGVVVDKLANAGDLPAPGKPLLTMYEQGRLWLEASVPEALMTYVHLNSVLTVELDAVGRQIRGRVVEIVPSRDPSTRTALVRVRVSDARDIHPGMFGRLLIPTGAQELLTIPAAAIIRAGQLTLVDVVAQGRLERRAAQLGRAVGDQFEVLSGLAPGETVVVRQAGGGQGENAQ